MCICESSVYTVESTLGKVVNPTGISMDSGGFTTEILGPLLVKRGIYGDFTVYFSVELFFWGWWHVRLTKNSHFITLFP